MLSPSRKKSLRVAEASPSLNLPFCWGQYGFSYNLDRCDCLTVAGNPGGRAKDTVQSAIEEADTAVWPTNTHCL